MKKKLPVVTVAQVEEADRLADLPLEATIALAHGVGIGAEAPPAGFGRGAGPARNACASGRSPRC